MAFTTDASFSLEAYKVQPRNNIHFAPNCGGCGKQVVRKRAKLLGASHCMNDVDPPLTPDCQRFCLNDCFSHSAAIFSEERRTETHQVLRERPPSTSCPTIMPPFARSQLFATVRLQSFRHSAQPSFRRSIQTTLARRSKKDDLMDKDSIDTTSTEYSKSEGDGSAAQKSDAFDPSKTKPEQEGSSVSVFKLGLPFYPRIQYS